MVASALVHISGICSHRHLQHFLLERRKKRCYRKESSPSCFGSKSSLCKLALLLMLVLHGEQVLRSSGAGEMQQVKAKLLCKGKSRSVMELCQHIHLERAWRGWSRAVVAAPGDSQCPTWCSLLVWPLCTCQREGCGCLPLRQLSGAACENNLRKDLVWGVEVGCVDHGLGYGLGQGPMPVCAGQVRVH